MKYHTIIITKYYSMNIIDEHLLNLKTYYSL